MTTSKTPKATPTAKTGPQIIDKMAENPTADRFFQSNPAPFTDEELEEFIAVSRAERAIWETKK